MKAAIASLALMGGRAFAGYGGPDAEILTTPYDPEAVVSLAAQVGMAVDIELAAGEQVSGVASGELAAFDLGVDKHHVVVRPRHAIEPTDLVIFTDRHTYRFIYHAEAQRAARPLVAVRFTYPAAAQARPEAAVRHENYWFCGPESLRPVAASDDGKHTYLRFPADIELPVLYRRSADGHEQLLNSHMEGDWVVVHEVSGTLVVRRARAAGCIERRESGRPIETEIRSGP